MKQNISYAKIILAAIFFQTTLVRADGTTTSSTSAPQAPVYNCGSMDPHSEAFTACQQAYTAANQQYQTALQAYNAGQAAQNQASQATEIQQASAAATLAEIKAKNDEGKRSYWNTSTITNALGMASMATGAVCSATCSAMGTGCCSAAPYFYAAGAALMITSSLAKKQSDQHAQASMNACISMNQLSSSQTDCSPNQGSSTTISYDPVTGQCIPASAEACQQLPGVGAPPPNVKSALSNSAFAAGNVNDQFQMLPDGSVKVKNGKIYTAADFQDVNSLMKAGLSAANAKSVMDTLEKAGIRDLAKMDLNPKKSGQGLGGADGTTTVVDVDKNKSDKTFKNDTKEAEERKPSSVGLVKEFNGELIGVAGDDIFLMMNRRYKLKSEQDSFIAQDLK